MSINNVYSPIKMFSVLSSGEHKTTNNDWLCVAKMNFGLGLVSCTTLVITTCHRKWKYIIFLLMEISYNNMTFIFSSFIKLLQMIKPRKSWYSAQIALTWLLLYQNALLLFWFITWSISLNILHFSWFCQKKQKKQHLAPFFLLFQGEHT